MQYTVCSYYIFLVNWIKHRHMRFLTSSVKVPISDVDLFVLLALVPLRVGISNLMPFNRIDARGGGGWASGFDTDMWKIAADKAGVGVTFHGVPIPHQPSQVCGWQKIYHNGG